VEDVWLGTALLPLSPDGTEIKPMPIMARTINANLSQAPLLVVIFLISVLFVVTGFHVRLKYKLLVGKIYQAEQKNHKILMF
jgi:hypothetical protein